jgi:hypothetical protein
LTPAALCAWVVFPTPYRRNLVRGPRSAIASRRSAGPRSAPPACNSVIRLLSAPGKERVVIKRVTFGEIRRSVSSRGRPVCLQGASGGPTGRRRLYPVAGKELRRSRPAPPALSVLMSGYGGRRRTTRFRPLSGPHSQTLTPPQLSWLTHAFGAHIGFDSFDTPHSKPAKRGGDPMTSQGPPRPVDAF